VRDIVNIYDAVTGVLQQSLSPSETVTKIQASPDGSTLFFAHSSSVTMWDVQTGGLIHTFTTQLRVNDIAVSVSGITLHVAHPMALLRSGILAPKRSTKVSGIVNQL
jgi:WD40 repeat protein